MAGRRWERLLLLQLLLAPLLMRALDAALPLPDFIRKCPSPEPAELNACIVERAKEVLPHALKGVRKYGIPALDPMHVERIDFKMGAMSITFTDVEMLGCKDAVLTSADVRLRQHTFQINFTVPKMIFRSNYAMAGRILVVPLDGKGNCTLTFDGVKGTYNDEHRIYTKDDGLEYIDVTNPQFSFTADKVNFKFDNLFNGNENLEKTTNQFLNENWKSVFEEMKEGASQAMRAVISSVMSGLCDVVPYKEIYPVDG